MEEVNKEFYFKELNCIRFQRKLNSLIDEGWRVLGAEPIGETSIKLICSKREGFMNISDYSTKELVQELERRNYKSIFVEPRDAFTIDIEPQHGSVGDCIKGEGAITILIIED
jgi:hypothetical protein